MESRTVAMRELLLNKSIWLVLLESSLRRGLGISAMYIEFVVCC
jgi:hypothetical protein